MYFFYPLSLPKQTSSYPYPSDLDLLYHIFIMVTRLKRFTKVIRAHSEWKAILLDKAYKIIALDYLCFSAVCANTRPV